MSQTETIALTRYQEDGAADFLLNSLEHYQDATEAACEMAERMGGKPGEPLAPAIAILAAWRDLPRTDAALFRKIHGPERGDMSLRRWLNQVVIDSNVVVSPAGRSWLWPDRCIGKRESRRLRDEHNRLVNLQATTKTSADFADVVIEILENESDWSSDTLDRIAQEAILRLLARTDAEGQFKRMLP